MKKKIIILSVILTAIIAVVSIFAIRHSNNKEKEANVSSSTTENVTESITEMITESTTEVITEESTTESTTENTTEKVTESTKEKITVKNAETTTKKPVTTTKPETTTQKHVTTTRPETTTQAAKTMFTADLPVISPSALELALFDAINEERENAGIAKLKWNNNLHFFARKRAEEVSVTKSHYRPNGTKFYTIYKEYGVTNTETSENLAYGRKATSETIVEAYVKAWMESSGHRDAILNPNNRYAAMGTYTGSDGVVYAVTLFHK